MKRIAILGSTRSEEHTSELQSLRHLVCRLLLEKKKKERMSALLEAAMAPCGSLSLVHRAEGGAADPPDLRGDAQRRTAMGFTVFCFFRTEGPRQRPPPPPRPAPLNP